MKNTFKSLTLTVLTFLLILASCSSPSENKDSASNGNEEAIYDAVLAEKYGADDYGMKKYVMAFLYRGSNPENDSLKAAELQNAHMKNISRLAEQGKLVLAGPFFGDGDLRGIYIFDATSIEEAEALTMSDPAIEAGVLRMELLEWYGSAALMGINEVHEKLSKSAIAE